jgi:hypothetical protein
MSLAVTLGSRNLCRRVQKTSASMANVYDGRQDGSSSDDDKDIRPPATARPIWPCAFRMRSGLLASDGMLDLCSDADEDDAPCRRPVQQAPAPATSGSCNAGPAAAGSGTALDDDERAAKRKLSAMAVRACASASRRPHRQGMHFLDPPARVANESCDAGGGIPKRTRKCAGSGGGATTHQTAEPQQRARPHRLLSRDRKNYTEAFEEYTLLRTIYEGNDYAFDVMRAKAKLDTMGAKWRAHPENKYSTLCLIRAR